MTDSIKYVSRVRKTRFLRTISDKRAAYLKYVSDKEHLSNPSITTFPYPRIEVLHKVDLPFAMVACFRALDLNMKKLKSVADAHDYQQNNDFHRHRMAVARNRSISYINKMLGTDYKKHTYSKWLSDPDCTPVNVQRVMAVFCTSLMLAQPPRIAPLHLLTAYVTQEEADKHDSIHKLLKKVRQRVDNELREEREAELDHKIDIPDVSFEEVLASMN